MKMVKTFAATVLGLSAFIAADLHARDAQEIYNQACIACHSSGAAGAPKTGDVAAWKPRLDKGMDVLLATTKSGIGAMPPKGMCMDCTDDEYIALIKFMSGAK